MATQPQQHTTQSADVPGAGTYAPGRAASGGNKFVGFDRDALIEAHLPQVKFIADRLAAKLPRSVDREDLISAGVLGLIDAANKYDPARGVLFKTYAETRVRGAMLDSLRDLDWVPRSVRRQARQVEAAYAEVEQTRGRAAEDEEVAERLGLSMSDFHSLLGGLRGITLTDALPGDEDADTRLWQVPDDAEKTPLAHYEREETVERLTAAIDALPERERQVIALYYLEELTMKEIGVLLGVTESRISQVHTQAVLRLRSALAPLFAAASQN
jgi:RNA polymerase sigma factor for flagellar operon FliA